MEETQITDGKLAVFRGSILGRYWIMRNPGLEPGSPYRTLEPESSASTNSASSAIYLFAHFFII